MQDRNPELQAAVKHLIRLTTILSVVVVCVVGALGVGLFLRTVDLRHLTALVCRNVEHLKTLRRATITEKIKRLEVQLRDSPGDAALSAELDADKRALKALSADKC